MVVFLIAFTFSWTFSVSIFAAPVTPFKNVIYISRRNGANFLALRSEVVGEIKNMESIFFLKVNVFLELPQGAYQLSKHH